MNILSKIKQIPLILKIIILIIICGGGWFFYSKSTAKQSTPQYKTAVVEKTNLVSTITTSGTIADGNNTSIYTSASGLVTKTYVKNGDTVTQGQKIAEITLDQDGQKRQTAALATYLSAKNAVTSSQQSKLSLQSQLESARKAVLDAQGTIDVLNEQTTYRSSLNPSTGKAYTELERASILSSQTTAKTNFTIAEEKYNAADSAIAAAKANLSSAYYSYQQASSTIYSPAAGIITNFALTPNMSVANLASSDSSSSTTTTTQSVGIITNPNNQISATVNLTEIDVVKVKVDQKVTLTMDAFPGKTFTGKVLAININGQSTSGVTSYPTIIILDSGLSNMYPNMAVSASIIVDSKEDVMTVPTTAISTTDGKSTVKVLKNNQVSVTEIEAGIADSSNTEIISGLSVGDTVVTSTVTSTTSKTTTTQSTSIFGGTSRMR